MYGIAISAVFPGFILIKPLVLSNLFLLFYPKSDHKSYIAKFINHATTERTCVLSRLFTV
jgi:hypothetical protein